MAKDWRFEMRADVVPNLRRMGMRGLLTSAEEILEASQRDVPVDTGELKRSGFVDQVDNETVAVGYRDSKAAAAHENMHVHYSNGRSAKFLENALNAHRQAVLQSVARQVRQAFKD